MPSICLSRFCCAGIVVASCVSVGTRKVVRAEPPRIDLQANRHRLHLYDHGALIVPLATPALRKYSQAYRDPGGRRLRAARTFCGGCAARLRRSGYLGAVCGR
jgi:hypothetical protein